MCIRTNLLHIYNHDVQALTTDTRHASVQLQGFDGLWRARLGVYLSSEVTYKFEVSIMLRSSDGIDVWVRIWGHC